MKFVVHTGPGTVEISYTWLPTWLGINQRFQTEMVTDLKSQIEGLPLDEVGLEKAHQLVIEYICAKNPGISGLYEYLDAIKYVSLGP